MMYSCLMPLVYTVSLLTVGLRVIILVLSMLIIIPLLTVSQVDASLALATQMIHRVAMLKQANPVEYGVSNRALTQFL